MPSGCDSGRSVVGSKGEFRHARHGRHGNWLRGTPEAPRGPHPDHHHPGPHRGRIRPVHRVLHRLAVVRLGREDERFHHLTGDPPGDVLRLRGRHGHRGRPDDVGGLAHPADVPGHDTRTGQPRALSGRDRALSSSAHDPGLPGPRLLRRSRGLGGVGNLFDVAQCHTVRYHRSAVRHGLVLLHVHPAVHPLRPRLRFRRRHRLGTRSRRGPVPVRRTSPAAEG